MLIIYIYIYIITNLISFVNRQYKNVEIIFVKYTE